LGHERGIAEADRVAQEQDAGQFLLRRLGGGRGRGRDEEQDQQRGGGAAHGGPRGGGIKQRRPRTPTDRSSWASLAPDQRVPLMRLQHLVLAVLVLGGSAMTATSDEGMWLLNDPPRERLKERYNFELTDEWLKRAMLASVRLNSGG